MTNDRPGQASLAVCPTHPCVGGMRSSVPFEAIEWTRTRNLQPLPYDNLTMDVVAGISLAASVMTLVDFGLRLTRNAKQISRSVDGSLDTNHELEEITTRINGISKSLRAEHTGNPPPVGPDDRKYQESIRYLSTRSEDVSNDLILHLQHLKARKSRGCYDVPLTAVRSMLRGARTKALRDNLNGLQQTLYGFVVAQMR